MLISRYRHNQTYHHGVSSNLIPLLTAFIAAIGIIYNFKAVSAEWDISLTVQQNISGAIGGEPFVTQPVISIYNLKGLIKYTNDLKGRVIAELEQSSATVNDEDELLGLKDANGECHVNDEIELSAPLIDGDAAFLGLCVNTASSRYRIKYTLKDEYNITMGSTKGAEFDVSIGKPYQIGVVQSANIVYGGTTWDTKSIVAVQDRGRNTVPSVNNGTVSIFALLPHLIPFSPPTMPTHLYSPSTIRFGLHWQITPNQ